MSAEDRGVRLCRESKEVKPYVREGGLCRDCRNDLNAPIAGSEDGQ